jgi:multidrug efflux system membrane fusion protein
MNIYLNQIGTVTPLATVTVRSRVAGQILSVNFKEGQTVKANQSLFEIDPKPYQAQLEQYEGQLARDQATLANARTTLQRYHALFAQGVIANQDLDNQQALYRQAQGAIENDEGLIESVKVNLAYCHVLSPLTGRIGLRLVDPGNYVQATDNLVVVTQLQPISVIFSVPEDNIQAIMKEMNGGDSVPVQVWNRDFSTRLAEGFLLTFDNEVDQSTGTVKLRAQFANEDNELFPNQFVNAKLLLSTLHDAILVPTAGVQRTQQGSYVYVVKADKTVERQSVVVGPTQGDTTAIKSGLNAGDIVVTDGLDKLQPGNQVVVRMDKGSPATTMENAPTKTTGE